MYKIDALKTKKKPANVCQQKQPSMKYVSLLEKPDDQVDCCWVPTALYHYSLQLLNIGYLLFAGDFK